MRIHYIMHAAFEKPGVIETWALQQGHSMEGTHTYRGEKLPSCEDFDFLIILGGPQSACELDEYPVVKNYNPVVLSSQMLNYWQLTFMLLTK
ncbi:hypothetical protein BH10PSE19_BH10PSE19_01820 [soil metagenome]